MPIKIKNANVIPSRDYETITILGLELPITGVLPFGGQTELIDLKARNEAGEFGDFEFLMRLFCTYTMRLPKREWVRYAWLSQQNLEADEIRELVEGTVILMNGGEKPTEDQAPAGDEGNAEEPATES